MVTRTDGRRRLQFGLLILALLAAAGTAQAIRRALADPRWGGFDLHPYWFYGHFVWQGENPYRAHVWGLEPRLPIHYLDGVTLDDGSPAQAGLGLRPPNTAPLLLLLALLSRFSWPTAKAIWLVVNLATVALIPRLTAALWPFPTARPVRAALTAVAWALVGTRVGLIYGQTTFVVVACGLAAVVWRARRPWAAGLLLGLALSKYSVALGPLLFLLWDRRWRVVGTAVLVQLLGLLIVSALGPTSPAQTVAAYLWLAGQHAAEGGINLQSIFGGGTGSAVAGAALATAALVGGLLWLRRHGRGPTRGQPQNEMYLLALLALWSLLAVYHLSYDLIAALPAFLLWLDALVGAPNQLAPRARRALWIALIAIVALLTLPDRPLIPLLHGPWVNVWKFFRGAGPLLALTAGMLWLWSRPELDRQG